MWKSSGNIWGYDVIPDSSLSWPRERIGNKQVGVRRHKWRVYYWSNQKSFWNFEKYMTIMFEKYMTIIKIIVLILKSRVLYYSDKKITGIISQKYYGRWHPKIIHKRPEVIIKLYKINVIILTRKISSVNILDFLQFLCFICVDTTSNKPNLPSQLCICILLGSLPCSKSTIFISYPLVWKGDSCFWLQGGIWLSIPCNLGPNFIFPFLYW